MKFYSYEYVLNQIRQDSWLLAVFLILVLVILGFTAFQAYRDKRDSKYRELVIILGLVLLVSGLSGFESLQAVKSITNTAPRFILSKRYPISSRSNPVRFMSIHLQKPMELYSM